MVQHTPVTKGLEISSPWVVNQEQLVVEALWPRLHQAWKEKGEVAADVVH